MRRHHRVLALLASTTALALAPSVGAQTEAQRADARAAATAGAEAFEAGRFDEAVDLFSRAESLLHAPPHLLFIARSHVKLGHFVLAQEFYRKVTVETLAPGAPPAFARAQESARTELAALEPRIPRLKIKVTGAGKDAVETTMDGSVVPAAVLGIPRPVDPGTHKLRAVTVGKASEEREVTLKEGESQAVELALVDGAPGSLSAPPVASAAPATSGAATARDAPPPPTTPDPAADGAERRRRDALRSWGYVGGAVGVLGIGFGIAFAKRSSNSRAQADGLCDGDLCPRSRESEFNDLKSDAESAKTISTVSWLLGGVGLAAGTTLFVLSLGGENKTATVSPYIGPGSAGVTGRF